MKATVFGATGFIGSHLVRHLADFDVQVATVGRDDPIPADMGHVFYCIGLTADFRSRPLETVDAHVETLTRILRHGGFASFLYLSSTRVYLGADSTREDATLRVNPNTPDDLYNLSKLMGEAACLAQSNPAVRVARLSNVYGPGMGATNFLGSIVHDAAINNRLTLNTAAASEKDYISVADTVRALTEIAFGGRHRLFNVAAGHNTTHGEIAKRLADRTGCTLAFTPDAPVVKFPPIDTARLREGGLAQSSNVVTDLDALIAAARDETNAAQ